jgi:hypothetical protein
MKFEEIYLTGEYLEKNPTWHVEKSPWKSTQILKMLNRNPITPRTICEVGCGAGEILKQVLQEMDATCSFWGYEISPQAFELSKSRENERLHFSLADITKEEEASFDLILLMDVIEHIEDCFSFLRNLKPKSEYKMIHFVLDLSVESLLRPNALLGFRSTRGHVGHVHYFTKNMALAMLEDLGYEVLDYFYTPRALALADTFKKKLFKIPRALFYAIRKDLAVRILGGYGLMVLVK